MKRAPLALAVLLLAIGCAETISITAEQARARYPAQIRAATFEEKMEAMLALDKALTVREIDVVFGDGKQVVKGSDVAAALFLPPAALAKRNRISVPVCPKGQTSNCPTEEMVKQEYAWQTGQRKIGVVALCPEGCNRGSLVIYQMFVDGAEIDLKQRRIGAGIL